MILKVSWMILLVIWIQARQQNEEWIRKQTRAEAKKGKGQATLAPSTSLLTDQYQISYTEALEKVS